ncbi:MAG: FtsX-like permease family protein [Candidatus Hodarchaeota archaeon]
MSIFRNVILLACGVGFIYVLLRNLLYTLEKRKKVERVQKAAQVRYSSNKANVLGFGYRYARHYLRTHRKRAIVLLFGFVAATTIVTSSVLWPETAPYVVLEKGLENQAFPLVVRPESASVSNLVYTVQLDLNHEELVETSKIILQSQALYGIEGYNLSHQWYPEYAFPQIFGPVDYYIGQLDECFIIPEDYLAYVEKEFYVNGTFQVSSTEVVISRRLLTKLNQKTNRTYELGSYINISVAQHFADTEEGENRFFHFDPYNLTNMKIVGIFVRKPIDPLIGAEYSQDTLGDAIFISQRALTRDGLRKITNNGNIVTTRLFVRLSKTELAARGIGNLKTAIKDLENQIEERRAWRVIVDSNTGYLYSLVDTYAASQLLVIFLLVPPFCAAFLFIIFSSRLLFQDRKRELTILEAKGASIFQIFYGSIMEMIILAVLGSILGILASIGNMFLIAGTKAFMEVSFDWALIWDIIDIIITKPWLWIVPPLLCSVILIFSVAYQINNFLKKEDAISKGTTKPFLVWISDNYLDVAILIGSYFILVFTIFTGIINFILTDPSLLAILLLILLVLWIALSLISTKVETTIGRPATYLLKPFLKNRSIFILKNFQRRQSQLFALGGILVLAGSIFLFSVSYQTTVQSHTEKVVTFTVGADLRLQVEGLDPEELANRLENINGIRNATPVLDSWGFVGERSITIKGIFPAVYLEIIEGKIPDPEIHQEWKEALGRLANQSNSEGIIINTLIAQKHGLNVGDNITLGIRQEYQQSYTIAGFFSSAPAFGSLSEDPETYTGNDYGTVFLSASSPVFAGRLATLSFCKVEPGTDLDVLTQRLYAEMPEIEQIQTQNFDIKNVGFLSLTGTAGILTFNFIMSIFTFFLTLFLFFTHVVDQRREEYAIMRVCGARKRDLYKVISGEGLLMIGMSFGISLILGLTFAWIFSKISLKYLPFHSALPLSFEFPMYVVVPLTLILLLMVLLGTIFPARRARGQNITNILKNL